MEKWCYSSVVAWQMHTMASEPSPILSKQCKEHNVILKKGKTERLEKGVLTRTYNDKVPMIFLACKHQNPLGWKKGNHKVD